MLWQRSTSVISMTTVLGGLLVMTLAVITSASHAGPISYADVGPVAGVSFTNIKESSVTDDGSLPLYGPPEAFVVGLDFDPTGFGATASGGAIDTTDGQLNFTVMGNVNLPNFVAINSINLFEAGDFTLAGTGTAATQAMAGLIIRATVTQVNGVNVAPIVLVPVNASVGFNLVANPGIVQPWSLGVTINVAGQLAQNQKATKVEVQIDNQLLAFSEQSSVAFIAKKEFIVNVASEGGGVVPEPSVSVLAGMALYGFGIALVRRRAADRA